MREQKRHGQIWPDMGVPGSDIRMVVRRVGVPMSEPGTPINIVSQCGFGFDIRFERSR